MSVKDTRPTKACAYWKGALARWLGVLLLVCLESWVLAQQPGPDPAQAQPAPVAGQPSAPPGVPPGGQPAPNAPAQAPAPGAGTAQPVAPAQPAGAPQPPGAGPAPAPQQPPGGAAGPAQPVPAAAQPPLGALPTPSQQAGVQYVELRPPQGRDERYYTQLRAREILGILSSGTVPPDKEAVFREYYEQYAFARWTWPEQFGKLPEFRRELRNELLTARGKPIHAQLRQLAFDTLSRFARDEGGPYHPATRVSAVLAIADLNAQESVNPKDQPVVPLPEAAALLVDLLKQDNLPDAVLAAVLVGLRRHALLGIADQQLVDNELIPRLVTIAGTKVPPSGRSLEGHHWIRARAMELLGLFGSAGQNGEVAQLLVSAVAINEESPTVRRAAARALGLIDLSGLTKPTPQEVLYALGRFISDVCEAEIKQLEEEIQAGDLPTPGRGLGVPGMTPYSPYPGTYTSEYPGETYMPEAYAAPGMPGPGYPTPGGVRPGQQATEDRTLPNRRRLKNLLNAAFVAITSVDEPMWVPANRPMDGVAAVVPQSGPTRDAFQQLFERLQAVLAICDTKDLDRQTLRDRIRAEYDQIQELLIKLEALGQTASTPAAAPQG
ncbi:MAG: hypothetical protein NZ899_09790 [Thermoguttaceae bacterium]|nr:hypothetical protein [Thermoguttaceae bacterium]MDW8077578.1 hypothetical protein [Thermoguttaceae bacterium]